MTRFPSHNDRLHHATLYCRATSTAHERGFCPKYVVFDSWYSRLKHLKAIRRCQWHWLTQLKSNRQVNLDKRGNQPVCELPISEKGTVVHLKAYGLIKVFKIVSLHGDIEYWATSDLSMNEGYRLKYAEWSWSIEVYHQGIKQFVVLKGVLLARQLRNGIIWVWRYERFYVWSDTAF